MQKFKIDIHFHSWIRFLERTTNRKHKMSSYLATRSAKISDLVQVKNENNT